MKRVFEIGPKTLQHWLTLYRQHLIKSNVYGGRSVFFFFFFFLLRLQQHYSAYRRLVKKNKINNNNFQRYDHVFQILYLILDDAYFSFSLVSNRAGLTQNR